MWVWILAGCATDATIDPHPDLPTVDAPERACFQPEEVRYDCFLVALEERGIGGDETFHGAWDPTTRTETQSYHYVSADQTYEAENTSAWTWNAEGQLVMYRSDSDPADGVFEHVSTWRYEPAERPFVTFVWYDQGADGQEDGYTRELRDAAGHLLNRLEVDFGSGSVRTTMTWDGQGNMTGSSTDYGDDGAIEDWETSTFDTNGHELSREWSLVGVGHGSTRSTWDDCGRPTSTSGMRFDEPVGPVRSAPTSTWASATTWSDDGRVSTFEFDDNADGSVDSVVIERWSADGQQSVTEALDSDGVVQWRELTWTSSTSVIWLGDWDADGIPDVSHTETYDCALGAFPDP